MDPLSNRTSYSYNTANLMTAVTNALGNTTTSVFDSLQRLIATVDPLGNASSVSYDVAGNPVEQINPLGAIWTTVYDDAGRVSASVDPLTDRTSSGIRCSRAGR